MTDLAGVAPYEATVVARELKEGSPTHGWPGDRRLSLHVAVLRAAKSGSRTNRDGTVETFAKGDITDIFLEVHRDMENGKIERLLSKPIGREHEIIPTLIRMDPTRPGHENVVERAERLNDIKDRENSRQLGEAHGEMMEHLWSIGQELLIGKPKTRFGRGAKQAAADAAR